MSQKVQTLSGSRVPYHLRQNKAVDRQLFLELLNRVHRYADITKYDYIGFGGLFFEDFRAIHSLFAMKRMISLESDEVAYQRQLFSRPLSCITCRNQDSSEYIKTFSAKGNSIHWFDYANPKQLREQFQDAETLLPKLESGDVLRVTFNANPEALGGSSTRNKDGTLRTVEENNQAKLDKLKDRIGDYLHAGTTPAQMSLANLPRTIALAYKTAVTNAMKSRPDLSFQHLSAFVYSDASHQMITITGIVINTEEEDAFYKKTDFKKWRYASLTWGDFKKINLPVLTLKERLYIDQNLPKWLHPRSKRKLIIRLDKDPESHDEYLNSYVDYYRHFPNFHRVMM